MPLSLTAMEALIADGGSNTAADVRNVIQALYQWIPDWSKHLVARLPDETAHASDDFFTTYSGYTEVNPTGAATWQKGRFGLSVKYSGQAAGDLGCAVKAVPSGPPLTIETCYATVVQVGTTSGVGLILSNGTAAGSDCIGFGYLADVPSLYSLEGTLNNVAANQLNFSPQNWQVGRVYFRVIWKSANTFAFSISPDGFTWSDIGIADRSFTLTPTHMGFFCTAWGSGQANVAGFHYLRVYAADLSV